MSVVAPSLAVRQETRPQGRVRPFARADLPAIARLHAQAFPERRMQAEEVDRYLTEIFCGHPWRDESCPSLVYETREGDVAGCLGVMPRPMVFNGRPIVAAVSHHFMVEPGHRSTMAAIHLVRAFLAGPQHLSLAEGNDLSRKFWEGLHATTSLLYSLHWLRPLRPAAYVAASLASGGWSSALVRLVSPLTRMGDAMGARAGGEWYDRRPTDLTGAHLDAATLASAIRSQRDEHALAPTYDATSLRWLLQLLASKRSSGELQTVAVRSGPQIVGWYVYFLRHDRASEVLQIGGRAGWHARVFDHLLDHARGRGAMALSGRLEPALMPVLAARRCVFRAGASWMLLQSSDRGVLDAIHRGDAWLSPLEGEWWMSA